MGLLARTVKRKDASQDIKKNLLPPNAGRQLMGLLGRAEKLRRTPQKPSLLRHAERLRQEVEETLGLRARAEKFRKREAPDQKYQQDTKEKAALKVKAKPSAPSSPPSLGPSFSQKRREKEEEKRRLPKAKELEEELPAFLRSMEKEKEQSKWESLPSFSPPHPEQIRFREQEGETKTHKRLEQYQVIFDVLKELQTKTELRDFWDSLCHAIVAELGAESVLVFSEREQSKHSLFLHSSCHSGLSSLPEAKLKKNKGLAKYLKEHEGVCRPEDIPSSKLSVNEKKIMKNLDSKIIFSLSQKDHIHAVFFIGPAISDSPYSLEDLDFLELLGELSLGSFLQIKEQNRRRQTDPETELELEHYKSLFHLSHRASRVNSLKEIYALLSEYIEYYLKLSMYSLVLLSLEKGHYYLFQAKGLSEESQKKYRLKLSSNIIGSISNLARIYRLDNFRKNPEIQALYSPQDLEAMENYWIVPLIHSPCLIGFINIHKMKNPNWSTLEHEIALSLAEIVTPYLLNLMIGEIQERPRLIQNPRQGLEERLQEELAYAQEQNKSLCLVDLRIQNLEALSESMEKEEAASLFSQVTKTLAKFLSQKDYLKRLELGHFALILTQKNITEAKKWLKELISKLPKNISSDTSEKTLFKRKLSYSYKILSPDPKKIEIEIERILKIFT